MMIQIVGDPLAQVVEISKNFYEVQVGGLTLKLKSSHDKQTVEKLISLVDDKITEAQSLSPNMSFQNALLLSALHIAEDVVILKQNAQKSIQSIENQTLKILTALESSSETQMGLDH
jgi:cell division protein ZapA